MFYVDVYYFNPDDRPFILSYPHTVGPFDTRLAASLFVRGLSSQFGFVGGIARAEIRYVKTPLSGRLKEKTERRKADVLR